MSTFNLELVSWTAATLAIELGANYLIRSGKVLPGGVLYGTTAVTFKRAIDSENTGLAVSNALWDASSTVLNTGLAIWVFGERLTGKKALGIALAVSGGVLLSMRD